MRVAQCCSHKLQSRRFNPWPFRITFANDCTLVRHASFKEPNAVIVDVGGVGYEVTIPISTFYELEEPGSNVKLRIYTHVREDALQLYGFKTLRERELFMRLISVSGIGPKLGITLLSGMSADEMIASIRTNNLARLVAIPGVGKKTAERMVVELRDKIAPLSSVTLEEEYGVGGAEKRKLPLSIRCKTTCCLHCLILVIKRLWRNES